MKGIMQMILQKKQMIYHQMILLKKMQDLEGIDPRETILPSGEGLELLRGVKNKEFNFK